MIAVTVKTKLVQLISHHMRAACVITNKFSDENKGTRVFFTKIKTMHSLLRRKQIRCSTVDCILERR